METIRRIFQLGSLTSDSVSSKCRFYCPIIVYQGLTRYVSDDMYAPDSLELLQKSGIDFQRHEEFGILPNDFAELLITSGLVLSDVTKWISFHRYVYSEPCVQN